MAADDKYILPKPAQPDSTQLAQHPKEQIRANIAIVIAILAALFTAWQAWEAHQARMDAKTASDDQKSDVERSRKAAEASATAAQDLVKGMQRSAIAAELSAKAGSASLTLTKQALIINERPWVGLTDEGEALQTSPLLFDGNGNAQIKWAVTAKNFGSTAAQNVYAIAFLAVSEDYKTIQEQWDIACRSSFKKSSFGYLLFPGKIRSTTTSGAIFDKSKMTPGYSGKLQAWMVGCVAFTDQFGNLYRERFKYWMTDPSGNSKEFVAAPNTAVSGTFTLNEAALQ